MSQVFVVVCYDIPDDRRRTKLHTALCNYGTPVQYSVFECVVDGRRLAQMQRAVGRIIKPRLDHVRYYRLCAACQGRIETTRGEIETGGDGDAWVV
ncbi:MAG: CRISPR-associated endonuclease Cas2 [Anaerolineales bacterium]|nr:CRISPR-associated endonuclease Cas2 [Anaerolineales bacterium]